MLKYKSMIKLILTDSQFNVFNCLLNELQQSDKNQRNLIFCEEKVSLMTEKTICDKFVGSFNTDVYSFGNYMRKKRELKKVLTKEGSSMVVKRVLKDLPLKRFSANKLGLSSSIYDLIAQLKSAKVEVEDLRNASSNARGLLKDKLTDVLEIYSAYQAFLLENGYDDQNSCLSYLPEIIDSDDAIQSSNVYLIGYNGFTAQMKTAIKNLLLKAKSVTAILVEGDNKFAYVNETANAFIDVCRSVNVKPEITVNNTLFGNEAKIITERLFNPVSQNKQRVQTDKIYFATFGDKFKEAEAVAQKIFTLVKDKKLRYKDFCVAVSNVEEYKDAIFSAFNMMGIPYFLDTVRVPFNHPLITLILSYVDVFKHNFERRYLKDFYKNPLVCSDKDLTDDFENYLLKYNVNYSAIKKPLKFIDQAFDTEKLENFRAYICSLLESFDVSKLLNSLNVKQQLELHTEKLSEYNFSVESDVNDQIYDAVIKILTEMQEILGGTKVEYNEYKAIFLSGVSALELSVIPQYNDAVFIGAFKEASLTLSKHLFCLGLTSDVPMAKEDVSVLTDSDINALEKLKILVEPKIRVVNHRERQNVMLGVSSFSESLYLSYPIIDNDGKQNVKSQVVSYLSKAFTLKPFDKNNGYLTKKQGFNSFAKGCSDFSQGLDDDFTLPASFYHVADKDIADKILQNANKQVKLRLNGGIRAVSGNITSPTAIEDYYKCPYRSFLIHGLRLKERKQGSPDGLSVGNVMHETLKYFLRKIDVITEENFDETFTEIIESVLSNQEFSHFFDDPETENSIHRTILECKKYCRKTLEYYNRTDFKNVQTEVGFGDVKDAEYPAVDLGDGKTKISGRIDRIDTFGDYFRIIDYKTGSVDATDKALFTGNKLQLYLYASAINDKKPAGVYYLPISDDFSTDNGEKQSLAVGKTLNDLEVLKAQDNDVLEESVGEFTGAKVVDGEIKKATDSHIIKAFMDYAKKISQKAVEQIDDGVIVASPYKDVCTYCAFKAMCNEVNPDEREVSSVSEQTIYDSTKGEEECPN